MPGIYSAEIISNSEANTGFFLLNLRVPEIAESCYPGNFVQIKIDFPGGCIWPRPFSVLDTNGDHIRILYKILGRGTRALSSFKTGRELNINGPLGNSFSMPEREQTVVLAGGGIGVPPLFNLAGYLLEKGYISRDIHFFNGAADADSLVFVEQCAELGINTYAVTEDGSMGIKGVITEGMKQFMSGAKSAETLDKVIIYSCGPMPMLKAVGELASQYDIPCQMALEALMPCGFGICMGCVVKVKDTSIPEGFRFKRVCRDGPVFDAADIIWD